MKNISPALEACPLFKGLTADELTALLGCLDGEKKRFIKNSFIFNAGEEAKTVGVVLSGAVHVLGEDFWGDRLILTRIEPGGLFGEAFSCVGGGPWPVSAQAALEAEILILDCRRLLTSCSPTCSFHSLVIKNLARGLAEKNIALTQRLEHVTRTTIRDKLLSYLSEEARRAGGNSFDIPFNRQELADYLAVDRSALSGVLSKMRAEKILHCRRSHFELLRPGPAGPYDSHD